MLNNFHFRNRYQSELKQLKTTIKALNKELEMLRRPQNSVEAPKTSDIINISSSPIHPACNYDELIRFRPKDQNNDIVIVTSTPINSSQLQAEIDDFLNFTSDSFDNMI